MGFRFRKSVKAGPFRINFSKSGVGYSVGTKGFRYTKKAGGGTRTTYSIPGTGLSYVTETSGKSSQKKASAPAYAKATYSAKPAPVAEPRTDNVAPVTEPVKAQKCQITSYCRHCHAVIEYGTKKCPHCGKKQSSFDWRKPTAVLAAVCAIGIGAGTVRDAAPAADPIPTYNIVETLPPTVTATQPINAETEPAAAQNDPWFLKGEFNEEESTSSTNKNTYVLNTDSGKYHRPGCQHVEEGSPVMKRVQSTREEMKAKGYSPCKTCDPG